MKEIGGGGAEGRNGIFILPIYANVHLMYIQTISNMKFEMKMDMLVVIFLLCTTLLSAHRKV